MTNWEFVGKLTIALLNNGESFDPYDLKASLNDWIKCGKPTFEFWWQDRRGEDGRDLDLGF